MNITIKEFLDLTPNKYDYTITIYNPNSEVVRVFKNYDNIPEELLNKRLIKWYYVVKNRDSNMLHLFYSNN
jgi:hypothetical protein